MDISVKVNGRNLSSIGCFNQLLKLNTGDKISWNRIPANEEYDDIMNIERLIIGNSENDYTLEELFINSLGEPSLTAISDLLDISIDIRRVVFEIENSYDCSYEELSISNGKIDYHIKNIPFRLGDKTIEEILYFI